MAEIIDIISQNTQSTVVAENVLSFNCKFKRMICFLIMFISLNSFGQQHISVFGFPLNGSINDFTTKLATKKIVVDKELNKLMPVGVRAFKGIFAGYDASKILVCYDSRTKNVYRCLINFDGLDEQEYSRMINDLKERIIEKRRDIMHISDGTNQEGMPKVEFVICDSKNKNKIIGNIEIGIILMKVFPYEKMMYVRYTDRSNLEKFQGSSKEDL